MIEIRRLGSEDVPVALSLLQDAYVRQRESTPVLPETLLGDADLAASCIVEAIANGAVGAVRAGRLIGFMGVSASFEFKGQRSVLIDELSHAVAGAEAQEVYGLMYEGLGSLPPLTTSRLHIVGHLSDQFAVAARLHSLGFGRFLTEEVRDLSEVPAGAAGGDFRRLEDIDRLTDLETEHRRYYRRSPIYLWKDDSPESVQEGLREWAGPETAVFVYAEHGPLLGFFAVSLCKGSDEGRLLRNSRSAQILSAYVTSAARGRGVGKVLLNKCILWAREHGHERIMVEHETANLLGSAFWGRYFCPYVHFVMRYAEVNRPDESEDPLSPQKPLQPVQAKAKHTPPPYAGSRDPRLVTVRRGGTLSDADHHLLALWAADCAQHVLHLFEEARPGDDRPRRAIEQARAWARGEITMTQARVAAYAAHAAARETSGAAKEAARAAGHAVAVAHMADHELGAAAYAIMAVRLASEADRRDETGHAECEWQRAQLPDEIRELVLDDQRLRNERLSRLPGAASHGRSLFAC